MTIQFSTTLRNDMLNSGTAITNVWNTVLSSGGAGTASILLLYTGSPPTNCAAAATGTQLAAINPLPGGSGAFSGAVGGAITLRAGPATPVSATNPITFVAGGGGQAGYFRFTDSDLTCHIQGTCGIPGSGADLIMSTTAIMLNQTIVITGFNVNCPGA